MNNCERFFLCLILLLAIDGCGGQSYKASPATPMPTAMQKEFGESDSGQAGDAGVFSMKAEAYTDTERQKTVFDADFTEIGVLAVYLRVRNGTGHAARINRDDITLILPGGHRLSPLSAHSTASLVDEKTGTSVTAGDVLGTATQFLVTGRWTGGDSQKSRDLLRAYESRAHRIEDYENKEFKDALLAPGESQSGFVFFKPPPGTAAFDAAALNLLFLPAAGAAGERVSQTVTTLAFAGSEPDPAAIHVPRSRRGSKSCKSGGNPTQRWIGTWEAKAGNAVMSISISDHAVTGSIATSDGTYRLDGTVNPYGEIEADIESSLAEDGATLRGRFPLLVTSVDASGSEQYRSLANLAFHLCS